MTELKPCPFCGGTNIAVAKEDEWEVMCMDCFANVGACCSYYTEAEAIEAWNKRVSCNTGARYKVAGLFERMKVDNPRMYFPDDGCMAGLAEGEVKP